MHVGPRRGKAREESMRVGDEEEGLQRGCGSCVRLCAQELVNVKESLMFANLGMRWRVKRELVSLRLSSSVECWWDMGHGMQLAH